jgi:hypothetical protein
MKDIQISNPEKTMKDLFDLTDMMNDAIHKGMPHQGEFHKATIEFINGIYDKVEEAATMPSKNGKKDPTEHFGIPEYALSGFEGGERSNTENKNHWNKINKLQLENVRGAMIREFIEYLINVKDQSVDVIEG